MILHTYIHTRVTLDRSHLDYQHVFGMWEEAGVTGQKPQKAQGKHADAMPIIY